MTQEMVSNELWEIVEQLLPEPVNPRGGRPRVPARAALSGIIYVLKSSIPWRMLPEEFGRSGVTCWRRLTAVFSVIDPYRMMPIDGCAEIFTQPVVHA